MNQQVRLYNYPIKDHENFFQNLQYKDHYIENSWILIPTKLMNLIKDFLLFKKSFGSNIEKTVYSDMDIKSFIFRLFKNRPLSFLGGSDSWVLKDLKEGFGNWENIGTNKETSPLLLKDYMSYDEVELSAFLSVSIFTPFINCGSRENAGKTEPNCQPNGIYIGQIGARFERPFKMEWRYMIVDRDQNTLENGYGSNSNTKNSAYLSMWANFYDLDNFPLYSDAENDKSGRFYKLSNGNYLDIYVYKKRIKIVAELFLKEANFRAKKIGKDAFCHIVGLGLGAWKLSSARDIQTIITVDTYLELISSGLFENISDLYFSWFNIPKNEIQIPTRIANTQIHVGHRNPADPLNDNNKLLVANWAWDSNSYVGNEFWLGQLKTSGDPASCSCSFVGFIGNPDICNLTEIHHFSTSS